MPPLTVDRRCEQAHRPALRAYHDSMLSIGDGQQGFKLEVIEKDEEMIAKTLSMAKASLIAPEEERSMEEHMRARSERYADRTEKKEMPRERSTTQRLWRMVKIAWPARAALKLGAIAALIIGQTVNEDLLFANTGLMFGCLMTRDVRRMVALTRNAALGALCQCLIWETLRYMQQELGTELAEKVWRNVSARYMCKTSDSLLRDCCGLANQRVFQRTTTFIACRTRTAGSPTRSSAFRTTYTAYCFTHSTRSRPAW